MKALITVLSFISVLLYFFLVYPENDNPNIVKFLILSQAIFFLYLAILYLSRRLNLTFAKNRNLWLLLIATALIIRVVVSVGADKQTYLSDDVYRYVWEGKLVANNYNPYITTPREMKQSGLADSSIYTQINHPWLPTIYPPLSEYFFVAAYFIGGDNIYGFKIVSFLFELMTVILIFLIVKSAKLPSWTFLIYLFSPLVIIEFLMSNHLDILAMPFFILMIIFLLKKQNMPFSVGVFLALAALVKLYALFFLPVLVLHFKGMDKIKLVSATFAVMFLFYMPFLITAGGKVFGSLWTYLESWQYNGSIYLLLKMVLNPETARIVCGILFVFVTVLTLSLKSYRHRLFFQMFIIFGAYVILTPSLFNWYLIWLLPFIILYQNLPFLILTGTILLSYHVLIGYYSTGVWSENWVLNWVQYLPFYGLLVYQLCKHFKKSKSETV